MSISQTVIFDFDGVLVNSEIIALNELRNCLEENGISVSENEMVANFLGSSFEDITEFVQRKKGNINTDELRNSWYSRMLTRYETELAVMKGANELLKVLAKHGHSYCIASGSSYRRLNFALKITGLNIEFKDRAFSVDSVARGKPEPDIFLYAASQLKVAANDCLVVEDAVAGVLAARQAGMRVVGYVGGDHLNDCKEIQASKLKSAGACTIVEDLLDIPNLMKRV